METNYRLTLQYDGTRYDGWQRQGNTANTIQGKLETVLGKMAGHPVEITGAGRTDAGVHALAQTANFHLDGGFPSSYIREYLNRYLPEDIAVLEAVEAPSKFHSRYHALEKTYLYRIEMSQKCNVFERKYICCLGRNLNVEHMERASRVLIGEHDFKSFSAGKKGRKTTVRTLKKIHFEEEGTRLSVRFTGDGFLHHMVRIIVGTLMEIGTGERSPDDMKDVLRALNRQSAGYTAPPKGLFLEKILFRSIELEGYDDKFVS